ncbi:unnamed protein product, partial [Didymodactylos carnosus]
SDVGLDPKDFLFDDTREKNSQNQRTYPSDSAETRHPPNNYQSPKESQSSKESQQRSSRQNEPKSAFTEYPTTNSESNTRNEPNSSNNSQAAANTITSFGQQPNYSLRPPPPPPKLANQRPTPPFSSSFDRQGSQLPPISTQANFDPLLTSTRQQPLPNTTIQKDSFNLASRLSPKIFTKQNQTTIDNPQAMDTTSADHYLQQIGSHDNPPVRVVKPNTQNLVYRKEIRIRYLQPPTPPPPAPIIIREKQAPPHPPQSPLLIRERKSEAHTPPPLTIRERPPTPPAPLEPHIIEKTLPPGPQQPRQIIIERLPTPPPKPRTVIFEKWLPYKRIKRPVLLQKAQPLPPPKPVRNVIIEYEPLKAFTVRRVIEEGVFRVDPHTYTTQHPPPGVGDIRIVERIEDLPPPSEQLMRVLNDYDHHHYSSNQHYTTNIHSPLSHSYDQHHDQGARSHGLISNVTNLFGGRGNSQGASAGNLTNVSRASSTPANRQERVLSGYNSSIPSPTIVPLGTKSYYREHRNSGDTASDHVY